MDRVDSLKKLSNAVDLLFMLEHLVDGLSKSTSRGEDVPWAGIKQTLTSIKRSVASSYEQLYPESDDRDLSISRDSNGSLSSSLAGRVQRVPSMNMGRVRELIGEIPLASQEGERKGLASISEGIGIT